MKHTVIVLILFLLLLTGCSSYQATLTMRDGAKIESELLSVRDSSIIIQEKRGAPIAIRNEDVDHVFIDAGSPAPTMIGLGLAGALAGFLVVPYTLSYDINDATIGAVVGAGVGTALGYSLAPSSKMFFLTNADQRHDLTFYAKYYLNEPDELKKIK